MQVEISKGSVWFIKLFVRIRVVKFVRRQRVEVCKGPARLKLERLILVTVVFVGSQVMPDQVQGVVESRLFHVDKEEDGSSKESLNWCR